MAAKNDPAKSAREARDQIEEFNRLAMDDAKGLSAPARSDATQALSHTSRIDSGGQGHDFAGVLGWGSGG